jgi:superfamily II DNA or RNA helicase
MDPDQIRHLYKKIAKSRAKRERVNDLLFSRGTYQVEIFDSGADRSFWTFLQFDSNDRLQDCFCQCGNEEACPHLASALLWIYNDHPSPLHRRFERSIWFAIAQALIAEPVEKTGDTIEIGPLSIRGDGKLDELIHLRGAETEENSIKFSSWKEAEIDRWREGNSPLIEFELSPVADIAKWLMFLQEFEGCSANFIESKSAALPIGLEIQFKSIHVKLQIDPTLLEKIIPTLSSIKTNLSLIDLQESALISVRYDPNKQIFLLKKQWDFDKHMEIGDQKTNPVRIGDFFYQKGIGFYSSAGSGLLAGDHIEKNQLGEFLRSYASLIRDKTKGFTIDPIPRMIHSHLEFDSDWNLHCRIFLKVPGDLDHPNTAYFAPYLYDGEKKQMILIENQWLSFFNSTIPKERVSEFVTKNRPYLEEQNGFKVHLRTLEPHPAFSILEDGSLSLFSAIESGNRIAHDYDFGRWLFVHDLGFYPKSEIHLSPLFTSGVVIHPDQIPYFIPDHRNELELIPNFFSNVCPIQDVTLRASLTEKGGIVLDPEYQSTKPFRLYPPYVYVEGEGFSPIPDSLCLPEGYQDRVDVDPDDVDRMIYADWASLYPHCAQVDSRLAPPGELRLKIDQSTGERGQFDVAFRLVTDQGSIYLSDLWPLLKSKKRYFFSEAGLLDLDDQTIAWLREVREDQIDFTRHTLSLPTLRLLQLHAHYPVLFSSEAKSSSLYTLLEEFRPSEQPDWSDLQSSLRPYQETGLQWLWFLYEFGLSGLLCDDMGLGKTHQTMALMAAISQSESKLRAEATNKNQKSKSPPKFLVVCPTSVIYHWEEKLREFLPHMRVSVFHGTERWLDPQSDVIVTSYGIVRREKKLFDEIDFTLAIFDEIQIAKNHQSRVHHTLQGIRSRMRLGLTGTPIENQLRELKALFDLILPGYFPGEKAFRDEFVKPIEKERNLEQRDLLARLIKPFVMRRKKEEVLLDLPGKIEEISHCDLSPEQSRLYNQVLDGSAERLLHELDEEGKPIPYTHIFAILGQLKQICDHPALYLKDPDNYENYSSGKWELCKELILEAQGSQQKVVVFSQYLIMLDIFEKYLQQEGISYASIRGSTRDRGEELRRFKEDSECRVFLGSLQAVGLGVDLTAASVVIHFDRWWNAARENQATDRVHRLGQTRGVQVFKLVTKDTLEERIDQLIRQKGALMEEVVESDDQSAFKKLSREELRALLRRIGGPTNSEKE